MAINTHNTLNVIIVDDDEMTRFIHDRVIRECGLADNLASFASAESCLEFIKSAEVGSENVIFLDINMPGMDGWQFLNHLCDDSPCDIKVILTTSSVDFEDRNKAEEYTCVIDYVEKPLTVSKCHEICSSIIKRSA